MGDFFVVMGCLIDIGEDFIDYFFDGVCGLYGWDVL